MEKTNDYQAYGLGEKRMSEDWYEWNYEYDEVIIHTKGKTKKKWQLFVLDVILRLTL